MADADADADRKSAASAPSPSSFPPSLILDLRLRRLEATIGEQAASPADAKPIALRAQAAEKQVEAATAGHSALRRFVKEYDTNQRILDPSFRVSNTESNAQETLSVADQLLLIQEAEPELRALERVLLECQALDQRGVTGSGNLADYEQLQQPLSRARETLDKEIGPRHAQLEERFLAALESYQLSIDTLSRLFIDWDHILRDIENKVGKLEREKAQREQ